MITPNTGDCFCDLVDSRRGELHASRVFQFVSRSSAILVCAALLTFTLASEVRAQDGRDQARQEFQRGVAAFETGDFRTALQAFQEAYRLAPHATVRVNIANCYDQLQRPVEALFHFERYLEEARQLRRPLDPARTREIQATMRRLRGNIGELELQVFPEGASVRIGADERRAPIIDPVRLAAGRHEIVVSRDGFAPRTYQIEIVGGRRSTLDARLERSTSPDVQVATQANPLPGVTTGQQGTTAQQTATAPQGSEPPVSTGSQAAPREPTNPASSTSPGVERDFTPAIVLGTASGVVFASALVLGVLSTSANTEFENAVRDANDSTQPDAARSRAVQDGVSAAGRARDFALIADVLGVASAVGAAITIALVVAEATRTGPSTDEVRPGVAFRFQPAISPTVVGATLSGTF